MFDNERINFIERISREYCEDLFPGSPCGFLVSQEGDVLSGTVEAGYHHPTLRVAIDATAAERRRKTDVKMGSCVVNTKKNKD